MLGFNHGDHLHRMCNETGIPEFLEFQIPGIPMVDPSTNQVSKSYKPHPVTFPYPPDPGEHVLATSSAPTTLVERDKLDLSSLIPPKGEMESSFSWTCPFKSPTSSILCFGEPTLGKLNQETDFYMTKRMPKPSSGANRVSVGHSSLVTKNGEHFYGENFIHDFPKSWKHIKEVDWGDKLNLNYTPYGYMLMEIDWGGKFQKNPVLNPASSPAPCQKGTSELTDTLLSVDHLARPMKPKIVPKWAATLSALGNCR